MPAFLSPAYWIGRRDALPPREYRSTIECTRIDPRPPQKPPAKTGLGIKLGDVWRKAQEKKQKEPKKP